MEGRRNIFSARPRLPLSPSHLRRRRLLHHLHCIADRLSCFLSIITSLRQSGTHCSRIAHTFLSHHSQAGRDGTRDSRVETRRSSKAQGRDEKRLRPVDGAPLCCLFRMRGHFSGSLAEYDDTTSDYIQLHSPTQGQEGSSGEERGTKEPYVSGWAGGRGRRQRPSLGFEQISNLAD